MYKHVFGPVPSRRLGVSLGVDSYFLYFVTFVTEKTLQELYNLLK